MEGETPGGDPVCPRDGGALTEVGPERRFLECACGYKFDSHLSREAQQDGEGPEPPPVEWDDVAKALDITVKKDAACKTITFGAMLTAQTEDDQMNIGFQAESSAGKSYIALEVAKYFPEDEVLIIGGASPTAFFHEYGEWLDERKVMKIDMEGKILVFLDFPDYRLLEKLRPLLSHDRKVITFKITDKSEKHGLRTKTVELVGYPVVVFCSTKLTPDEQERTRLLLLSPSVDQAKLDASLRLLSKKLANRAKLQAEIDSDPRGRLLRDMVARIRASGIRKVDIEGDIYAEFVKRFPHHQPKHQRDLPRVASLIKAHALMNFGLRERDEDGTLIATQEDVEAGFELYERVSIANELGVSPYVVSIYRTVIEPILSENGTTRKEVYQAHYAKLGRTAPVQWFEKEVFPALVTAGLIIEEADEKDRRRKLIYPPHPTTINSGFRLFMDRTEAGDNSSGVRGVNPTLEARP
jgi:hypothetical protein